MQADRNEDGLQLGQPKLQRGDISTAPDETCRRCQESRIYGSVNGVPCCDLKQRLDAGLPGPCTECRFFGGKYNTDCVLSSESDAQYLWRQAKHREENQIDNGFEAAIKSHVVELLTDPKPRDLDSDEKMMLNVPEDWNGERPRYQLRALHDRIKFHPLNGGLPFFKHVNRKRKRQADEEQGFAAEDSHGNLPIGVSLEHGQMEVIAPQGVTQVKFRFAGGPSLHLTRQGDIIRLNNPAGDITMFV